MQNGTILLNSKGPSNSKRTLRQVTSTLRKMSEEMLDTAEETIIDFITCPFCDDYIRPPSLCCENGHFICTECKLKISNCPSCGTENYPNKSNAVFDMILKEIYYPCIHQASGCLAYFKYNELVDHQLHCKFKLEPCKFRSEGCDRVLKRSEKIEHESMCEYGIPCRVYAKIKGEVRTWCVWRGSREYLPNHVAQSHQFAWSPHEMELNVALSWILPLNFDFEKIELIHLKDVDEMFYFYSKTIENSQHFVAVQYIGSKDTWKKFMYSVEFIYENKKFGFEDLVLSYKINENDIYNSSNCFSVQFEFLKKHFLAERVIDCYVKVFKKGHKSLEAKKYLTSLDKSFTEE